MGITVISSASVSTAASSPLPATASSDASPSGFAALLSGQIGSASELATSPLTGEAEEVDSNETDAGMPQDLVTTDPALAFFNGLPAQTTPIASSNTDGLSDRLSAEGMPTITEKMSNASAVQEKPLELGMTRQQETKGQQNEFTEALKLKTQSESGVAANLAAETTGQASSGQESAAGIAASANQQKLATEATNSSTTIETPLHTNDWSRSFGEKIVWLAKSDQQTAQININPPQLGPVQITLHMNGDQASAIFASPHAEVRQAIENSLPQLKEMLAGAGINLGQADVGANMAQQNREAPFQAANGNRSTGENAILPGIGNTADSTISTPVQRGRGLVDLFA